MQSQSSFHFFNFLISKHVTESPCTCTNKYSVKAFSFLHRMVGWCWVVQLYVLDTLSTCMTLNSQNLFSITQNMTSNMCHNIWQEQYIFTFFLWFDQPSQKNHCHTSSLKALNYWLFLCRSIVFLTILQQFFSLNKTFSAHVEINDVVLVSAKAVFILAAS